MKTFLFEQISWNLDEEGTSKLMVKGHTGKTELSFDLEELDIFMAETLNHRSKVIEFLRQKKEQENLLKEKRR